VKVPVSGLTVDPELITFTTFATQSTVPYAVVEPSTAHDTGVTWSSSNPAVATVDPVTGVITTLANGTANIIATSTGDPEISDYCAVTVAIPPTGVSVSPAGPVSLVATGAGSTQQLSATVQPNPQANQAVIWSGGSASIATVNSSGLVTAVSGAGGQTTVRATTVATPVRTADVTINVNPAQPGVITGVANIANGGTVTLSVPAVTGDTYTWTYPTANFNGSSTTNSITLTAKTVSTNAAGSISVVAKAPTHGGTSPSRATTATVNVTPAQPGAIAGAADIANGGTVTLTVPAVAGATSYTWTFPTANFTGSSTTNSITLTGKTVSTNAAATFSVTATGVGGTSPARAGTTAINVVPAQPGAITGAANIANGGTVTLTVPAVAGATSYTWTFPTANFTGSSTTNSITLTGKTVSTNAAATFSVTATGVGGTSPARAGTTAINVVPAQPGTITPSPTTVTSGANVTLTVDAVPGATGYSWTFPTDYFTQTSPQTTATPTITLTTKSMGTAEANSFGVVATSAAGNSTSRAGSTNVVVNPVCEGTVKGSLCWLAAVTSPAVWSAAVSACSTRGCRLPTNGELHEAGTAPVLTPIFGPYYYWTSDSGYNGGNDARIVKFDSEGVAEPYNWQTGMMNDVNVYYRCVKSM
ncbi:MAG: Ig-like domain-containing protein, partial [Candidatus Symbiothrix sp.]|nr:Ig-like domain-containing protein [Candidatus Symbiothrix sp.]